MTSYISVLEKMHKAKTALDETIAAAETKHLEEAACLLGEAIEEILKMSRRNHLAVTASFKKRRSSPGTPNREQIPSDFAVKP